MASRTSDSVKSKIEAEFNKLDHNHDGYLDWSDYEDVVGRYKKTARAGEDDRRIRALRAFYQMHWLELLRHAGVDGDRLSKDQFVTATRRASADTSRLNVTETGGNVIFDLIDADGDGEISREELTRYFTGVWQINESDAMYGFDAMDRDGNQSISRDEFVSGINEFLQS